MSKILTCLQCGTGNDLRDAYCKECGAPLDHYEGYTNKIGMNEKTEVENSNEQQKNNKKKLLYLMLTYLLADVIGLVVFYLIYVNQFQTVPIINNQLDKNSNAYNVILNGLLFIVIGVTLFHMLLFTDTINQLFVSKQIKKHWGLYLGFPLSHWLLLFCITLVIYQGDIIMYTFFVYLLASGLLIGLYHLPYRVGRILLIHSGKTGRKAMKSKNYYM